MSEAVMAAVITGGLSLVGVVVTTMSGSRKIERKLEIHQAVTDEKIDSLTREVREHNHFAKRVPAMEEQIKAINEKVDIYHK